ncbi:MAG: nitrate/nitrite transporter [Eggerthellaceae bacterium]
MVKGTHYEKVVCACCFLFLCVNIGFTSTSFNVYQPYIVAVDGIGDTGGSLILAFRTLISLLCMLAVAKWYRLLDCRLGVFLASCLTAIGFFFYSLADNFFMFCLGGLFAGAGYGFGGMVAMNLIISRWFKSHVGAAVGIAATGSGFASIVFPFIITLIIENGTLHAAFLMEAVVALAVGLLVFALLRNYPSELGMQPYESHEKNKKEKRIGASCSLTPAARKLLFVAMIFIGAIAVDGWGYLSILMTTSGFDPIFAAGMLTLAGVCLAVAKAASGETFDLLGPFRGSVIFFTLMNVGLVLCVFSFLGNSALMTAAIVLFSVGNCLGTVGISVWSIDLSTPEERLGLVKDLQVGYAFGGFIFNLVPGPLMDVLGSYCVSYGILVVLGVICMAIVLGIYVKLVGKSNL